MADNDLKINDLATTIGTTEAEAAVASLGRYMVGIGVENASVWAVAKALLAVRDATRTATLMGLLVDAGLLSSASAATLTGAFLEDEPATITTWPDESEAEEAGLYFVTPDDVRRALA